MDDDGGQAQPLRYVAPWDSQASWQNWFGGFRLLKRHPYWGDLKTKKVKVTKDTKIFRSLPKRSKSDQKDTNTIRSSQNEKSESEKNTNTVSEKV